MAAPTAVYDIINLAGTPGNILVLLTWDAPSNFSTNVFLHTHVRFATDAAPSNISEGTHVTNVSGSGPVYTIHNNLVNGTEYYYSLFSVYQPVMGDPVYYGPYSIGPLIPASGAQIFTDLNASFTKLEHNTKLYSAAQKRFTTDLIIWLADGQVARKPVIVQALNNIKPAHTTIRVFWEPYFIAQTTSAQLSSASFDSSVYEVRNGTLINKVPTIDSSFGGDTSL